MMSANSLKVCFWASIALLLPTGGALAIIDGELRNVTATYGIVSFEFCGLTSNCTAMLQSWSSTEQAYAMLSLGLDYLFLLLYPAVIALAMLRLSTRLSRPLQRITRLVIASTPIISLADACENYALIQLLLDQSDATPGLLAGLFAIIKFSFLFISLLWLGYIGIQRLRT